MMDWDWITSQYNEPELITLLGREYAGYDDNTLICLSRDDVIGSFATIRVRQKSSGKPRCLADVKDKINQIVRQDDSTLCARDYSGLTPLHLICSLHSPGQIEILEQLCIHGKSSINILDTLSRTPLHHALSPQNLKYHSSSKYGGECLISIVKLLIQNGANVNCKDCNELTPLHLALDYYQTGSSSQLENFPKLINTLLEAGADILVPTPDTKTSLHLACSLRGPRPLVDILGKFITKENVNATDKLMRTPLHEALLASVDKNFPCKRDLTMKKVSLLVSSGANVNAQDCDGKSPLLIALEVYNCSVPLVKFLLRNGADASLKETVMDTTPMHKACSLTRQHLKELFPFLIKAGGSLNVIDSFLRTPFHNALQNHCCSVETLKMLTDGGADATMKDKEGNSSIHFVCFSAHSHWKSVVSFLICKGCNINDKNKRGLTPLLVLLQNHCDKESIKTLIDLGADCTVRNEEGISPLHMVTRSLVYDVDVDEIVEIILKGGADVNAKDCHGNTPLHYALKDECTSNIKAVRRLLIAGADPNIKNKFGKTPLHLVSMTGGERMINVLMNFKANINEVDDEYNTPLHLAQDVNENTVRVLIDRGADFTAVNNKKQRPFECMTFESYRYMIGYTVLLIAAGKYRLNERENEFLLNRKDYNKRYIDCFNCVLCMKNHFIGNSNISLLNFLLLSDFQASRYLRNPDIFNDLDFSVTDPKYWWYSFMIKEKLSHSTYWNEVYDRSTHALSVATSPLLLPLHISEKVLSYLDEDDLEALTRAVRQNSCSFKYRSHST